MQAIILFLNSVYLLSLKYVIHINVIHNNNIMFFLLCCVLQMIKLIKTTLGTGHDGTLFVCPGAIIFCFSDNFNYFLYCLSILILYILSMFYMTYYSLCSIYTSIRTLTFCSSCYSCWVVVPTSFSVEVNCRIFSSLYSCASVDIVAVLYRPPL